MKSIVLLLFIIGVIFIAIGYYKDNQQCPPPIVQFRYVPRTFEQEQSLEQPILSTFGSMFKDNSAWMKTQGYADGYYNPNNNSI